MTKPQDVFGTTAKTVLNKPYLQVQHHLATGTDGGAALAGDNDRPLNTVVANDITGASLDSTTGLVTLPPGTYYVEGKAPMTDSANGPTRLILMDSVDTVLLLGINHQGSSTTGGSPPVSGEITLAVTTDVKLVSYHDTAQSNVGLGLATDDGRTEVYADLRIWSLASSTQTLIVRNNGLYPLPATTLLTGNIVGLDFYMNLVTPLAIVNVKPGVCYDATNAETITLGTEVTANLLDDYPTPAVSTGYHLFLCKEGSVASVHFDTSVTADTLLAGDIEYVRWIGVVVTDASSDIASFLYENDFLYTDSVFTSSRVGTVYNDGLSSAYTIGYSLKR